MDFNIKTLWVLDIWGIEVWITQTMVTTWILMLALILLAVVIRLRVRSFQQVPKGLQNVVEAVVEAFEGMLNQATDGKYSFLGGWFFSMFAFLLFANISGLLGLRPPTADWTTTFAYALATFLLIQYMGLRYRGRDYIKSFFSPHVLFFPLNLVGELARPISLSFRLFGNILAGLILMTLVYELAPFVLRFALPAFLHAYFDIFSGALQAYIFCILSMTFVAGAAEN